MRQLFPLIFGVATALAVLLVAWGLPRGSSKRTPFHWYLGILILAASLVGWPLIYWFLSGQFLDMVWMLVWGATFWTFGAGLDQLQRSSRPSRFF